MFHSPPDLMPFSTSRQPGTSLNRLRCNAGNLLRLLQTKDSAATRLLALLRMRSYRLDWVRTPSRVSYSRKLRQILTMTLSTISGTPRTSPQDKQQRLRLAHWRATLNLLRRIPTCMQLRLSLTRPHQAPCLAQSSEQA